MGVKCFLEHQTCDKNETISDNVAHEAASQIGKKEKQKMNYSFEVRPLSMEVVQFITAFRPALLELVGQHALTLLH